MVQLKTRLKVADNSGAKEVMVIKVLVGTYKRAGKVGDVFAGTVKKADPHGTVKEHEIVHGVIIRTRKETRRKTGEYVRFDDNACVIINKETRAPVGTTVFGPVAREVKEAGFGKIASLAPEVI